MMGAMTASDNDGIDNATPAAADDSPKTRLAALQNLDTEIDQLTHRRERLPERDALSTATDQMRTWEAQRSSMRGRLDELDGTIERTERETAELEEGKERLLAQLKTVIAPREAEALMHEIEVLDEQRDVLETAEIEALEEQSELDDRLRAHLGTESSLREALGVADAALAAVVAEIDVQVGVLAERRDAARVLLDSGLLAQYDRTRESSGVAVARLEGRRCEGCHLDMSAAEADDVKDEAERTGGIADCPQCGRMLLV